MDPPGTGPLAATVQLVDAGDAGDGAGLSSPSPAACVSNDLVTPEPAELTVSSGFGIETASDAPPTKTLTTRRNCKGERRRSKPRDALIDASARVLRAAGLTGSDSPLPEDGSEETVLTAAQVEELTLRFLFGDPAGVKATGPTGAVSRASLGLVAAALFVRNELWPSRRPEIKALLADAQGRFDKEELLAHIINNALGRPLLHHDDARAVGTAANNALKKEKKETAEAKAAGDEAIRAARAAAATNPALLPRVAAAQAREAHGHQWYPYTYTYTALVQVYVSVYLA
jgi:hypothetical protein